MAPSRKSLTPCRACGPDGVLGEDNSKVEPCCDQTCLDAVASRECALQCGGDETSSCNRTEVPEKCDSSMSDSGTRKRKREACSTHSRSVREHYLATLIKTGCICAELIARNLAPCCKYGRPVSTRSTSPIARKVNLAFDLSSPGEESASAGQKCRGSDGKKNCSKPSDRSHLEKVIGCSVSGKVGDCTGKKDCCDRKMNNGTGPDDKKVDDFSPVKKERRTGSESFHSVVAVAEKQSGCCTVENQPCRVSEDMNDGHYPEEKTTSGRERERSCCSFAKENDRSDHKINAGCEQDRLLTGKAEVSCCELKLATPKSCCTEACRNTTGIRSPGILSCCSDNCQSEEPSNDAYCIGSGSCAGNDCIAFDKPDEPGANRIDIEKGAMFLEHVVLDVQGLTCTGCETKLFKSIQGIPGILNLRTSLVLSQAEFDLDRRMGLADEIIKSVEKATGFACQQVKNEGQDIEVIVDGDVKAFIEREYPDGVSQVIVSDKQTVRITYDAKIIGARKLLNHYHGGLLELAAPRGSSELENGRKHVRNTGWITLVSAILTVPVLILAWAPLPPHPIIYDGVSLALATIVQFAIAGPFYPNVLRVLLFTHVIEMDLLIVLSTSTAYIFSLVSFAYQVIGRPLPTGEFFETSTLLVTLIMLGRWVSAFARLRAVESVSIRSLQAETAVVCEADGRGEQKVDARLLQFGDFFKVAPDSSITTDGVIVSGTTEVDESTVTGESLPVEKLPGSSVIAGSINGSGVIVVRLTHLPGNNTISTIATMVDEAKFSKPKIQELADIIASYFVPVILILTIITFTAWIAVGISVRQQTGGHAAVNAIPFAISVLIVSCPCAIGLAVPMVIVISGGIAAKHGVVFKSAMAIETARKVSHVVFDKTGTLTQGELSVVEEVYLSEKHDLAASVALGLTRDSKHPVSAAISTYLKEKGVNAAKITDYKSVPGKGIEGTFNGTTVRCGNTRWLSAEANSQVQALLARNFTVFCVATNNQPISAFGLIDSLRPDSVAIITELQSRNIAISLISGDDAGAVNAIAHQLGIPTNRVKSRCTPASKQAYLKTLMANTQTPILFCGDGTNDAAALAQADIGVHMHSGSAVASTAADVVLIRASLSGILVLLDLSAAAYRRIVFNFAWAGVYNLFAVLLAAGAFVNARIPPQYAGLGEIVSVLPVVLVALQLKWFRPKEAIQ